jgi:hypothetical protein
MSGLQRMWKQLDALVQRNRREVLDAKLALWRLDEEWEFIGAVGGVPWVARHPMCGHIAAYSSGELLRRAEERTEVARRPGGALDRRRP